MSEDIAITGSSRAIRKSNSNSGSSSSASKSSVKQKRSRRHRRKKSKNNQSNRLLDKLLKKVGIMAMTTAFFTLALCYVTEGIHFTDREIPTAFFTERVIGSSIGTLSYGDLTERLPINGFGFSNPPAPPGSELSITSRTCGLVPPFCTKSRYRSFDGSCNNLYKPTWGMAETPYARLAPYNYADGVSAIPLSVTGQPLPLAREISLALFPDKQIIDPVYNLNAQQWGQIVTHDMSLTAGVVQSHKDPITCCSDDGQLAPDAYTNPKCAPLMIPPNDPIHSHQKTQCMNFVRTVTSLDRGCTSPRAPAEPISSVTAYMDLSLVYGNSRTQNSNIRAGFGGRMLTVERNGQEWPPQDPNVTVTCESAQSPDEPCFLAGDVRVNQNPQLTVLQIILLREHNRIADALALINPHWSDETTFQEARRINIAQFQHINYYEYLPILLGFKNMVKNKLIYPGAHSYVNDYNPKVNPSIFAEHATAAFRHFHTLIRGYLKMIAENRKLVGAVRLSDWFNRPLLLEIDDSFDNLARGLTVQEEDFSDQFWDSEITQFLFKRNNTFGGDLRATDIQRGRDHGLASYATARGACGLSVPETFEDMLDYISQENVLILKSLYPTAQDVELVVAGSLERHVPGTQVGPTFLSILTEQFYRTRAGDRFFYENGADPDTAFTPSQLESIRYGASMASLLCNNGHGIRRIQRKAFLQISPINRVRSCRRLPSIDFTLWRDARGHFK